MRTQLHWAARRGDTAEVLRQLARGVPVDARDDDGRTPLMEAAEGRLAGVKMLKVLLEEGADVNICTERDRKTPLFAAINAGSLDKVRCLVDAGADLHSLDAYGQNVLCCFNSAKCRDAVAILQLLVDRGADPRHVTPDGESPLRSALAGGNLAALKFLLERGVPREQAGLSSLGWAVVLGSVDDVARELQIGGLPNPGSESGTSSWFLTFLVGDPCKSQLFLNAGADLHERIRCGDSAMKYACAGGHAEMVRWLLSRGVDPDERDDFGQTALIVAAEHGAADCVDALLAAGADWRAETRTKDSAITSAASVDVVRRLLAAGADINTISGSGYPLLKSAVEAGNIEFVKALLELGADADVTSTGGTPLHSAVMWDHLDVAEVLLDAGANPDAQDVDGWTPLMYARSFAGVELLLGAGADPCIADQFGAEAIEKHSDPDIVDLLLASGATVQPRDPTCGTPLHKACRDGNVSLVRQLLDRGAHVEAMTGWRLTPTMAAAEWNHAEVVRILLDAGARVETEDSEGRTALHYAAVPEAFTAFQLARKSSQQDPEAWLADFDPDVAEMLRTHHADALTPTASTYGYVASDDNTSLELLLASGGELERADHEGRTPLLLAALWGRPARVAALLRSGACTITRDFAGQSAVDLAAEHHDPEQRGEILKLLSRTGG